MKKTQRANSEAEANAEQALHELRALQAYPVYPNDRQGYRFMCKTHGVAVIDDRHDKECPTIGAAKKLAAAEKALSAVP